MRLDRNVNPDGTGKYALVKMREVNRLRNQSGQLPDDVTKAFMVLESRNIMLYGDESDGDQFFVMKYKDKFTALALFAYARAAMEEAHTLSLDILDEPIGLNRDALIVMVRSIQQYAREMHNEAMTALKAGNRIPD